MIWSYCIHICRRISLTYWQAAYILMVYPHISKVSTVAISFPVFYWSGVKTYTFFFISAKGRFTAFMSDPLNALLGEKSAVFECMFLLSEFHHWMKRYIKQAEDNKHACNVHYVPCLLHIHIGSQQYIHLNQLLYPVYMQLIFFICARHSLFI